jgi:hypothetical protein
VDLVQLSLVLGTSSRWVDLVFEDERKVLLDASHLRRTQRIYLAL